jgi:DNA-3-methyladenine glycosylase II
MMSGTQSFDIPFTGDFSLSGSVTLAARAAFVESVSAADGTTQGETLDLVFPLENTWAPIAVSIVQADGKLHATLLANPAGARIESVVSELRRILSLDVDGITFRSIAKRDPVVSDLQKQRPGVRPLLFPTPYEAAARAIIGQRIQVRQAAKIHVAIAKNYGTAINTRGIIVHAFPAPSELAKLAPIQGLAKRKVEQLKLLGTAAADGWLDSKKLRAMARQDALDHLQKLPGIGPFSADLILIRGAGDTDAFPATELRLRRAMTVAYKLPSTADFAAFERIAEGWRPYRSWVGLLLRNSTFITPSGDLWKTP